MADGTDEMERYRAAVSHARGPQVDYTLRIQLPGTGELVETGTIPAIAERLRRHAHALEQLADEETRRGRDEDGDDVG